MGEVLTAVYEKGVLRPLLPLDLREHQTVRIQVVPEESTEDENAAIRTLVAQGLLTPPPGTSEVAPLSEEERRKLAERLGRAPGKPLSEIIIEERGER